MKKKILSLLAVCLLCMGLSTTATANQLLFGTEEGRLPQEDFSHPWVGDVYDLNDNYTYEVLEGSDNVNMNYTYVDTNGIEFLKTGTVKIRTTSKSSPTETQTYDFTIQAAQPPYVEYLIPSKVKVGYTNTEPFIYHNCLRGGDISEYGLSSKGYRDGCLTTNQLDFLGGPLNTDRSTASIINAPRCFSKPGTFYVSAKRDEDNPHTIVVEEPIINTNLPKKIQVGSELQLITSLDNTALENKKITDVKYDYNNGNPIFPLGYQPKIEILSGAELVERTNGDYSNILNTSENIKFTGEGTIVFKVTYEMLPISTGAVSSVKEDAIYSPEKTFSIEVVSEPVENIKIADHTDGTITADISGLDLNTIYKNNNLDPAISDIEISLTQQAATEKDSTKLKQRAEKDGYSVKAVYEFLMTLYADGNKITELTDNFGTLKLKLMAGKEYSGKKAIVYQLHNGNEIIVHNNLTVNTDGTVILNTSKLSSFAVAVVDSSNTVTTSVKDTVSSNGVKTGDNAIPMGLSS